ncbi:MAG: hypothetical protein BMS9Abin05_2312 [Rhodothermia bacterium]|nr:MAG: hypothetical protein BMS9Abin05_2312 [Rhodothermia bacterium]
MAEKAPRINQRVLFTLLVGFAVFTIFVYTAGTDVEPGPIPISNIGRDGRLLYQKYNCTSCHQLYGLGGYIGPDLTNAAGKGEAYLKAFLQNGSAVMPNYNLPEHEIEAITAYLVYVNETGHFPEKMAQRTWYGSFKILGNTP